MKISKVNKVIIPMAGLGTRLLPATKVLPKEMLPVAGKPIIQLILKEALESGFTEIIFVLNKNKAIVEKFFDKDTKLETFLKNKSQNLLLKEIKDISKIKANIVSVLQDKPKGLGHAILCAKRLIGKESFAVILPDMLISKDNGNAGDSLKEMRLNFEKEEISSVLLGKAKKADIPKYGIAKIKKSSKLPGLGLIEKIIEKPSIKKAPSNLYAAGRYIFNNDFFTYLSNVKPDKSNEVQLTDAIEQYIKDGKKVNAFPLDGDIFDCGDNAEYILANLEFAMKDPIMKSKIKDYLKTK